MNAEVKITIKPDGTVLTDVVGAEGSICEALTEPFNRAIGEVIDHERKPEFFREVETHVRVRD